MTMKSLSRRSFLVTTSTLAMATSMPTMFLGATSALAEAQRDSIENISFLGANKVQLTIIDTKLTNPQREVVADTSQIKMRPTNNIRHLGFAELDGIPGFISGNMHATAEQLFRPLATIIPDTALTAFDGQNPLIDQPQSWIVQVDNKDVIVRTIYRKSRPIRTEPAGLRSYNHTRRHLVTLELAEPIPEQAFVSLQHPGLGTLEADRNSSALSEVVHICQQGYPTNGPKKGYVGLWLGHTETGMVGTTDDDFSDNLRWNLINTETGSAVATGRLTLVKAVDDPHMQDQNFNGCDIYEADFSDFAEEGTYRLQVEKTGASFPFSVSRNPYQDTFRAAARWYFHQRSGIAIDAAYGEGRTRPRNGHPNDGLTVWQSNVALGPTREGYGSGAATDLVRQTERLGALEETDAGFRVGSEHPNAWGGWHDAGDWDRRIEHMDAVYTMANMVEILTTSRTLDLNLPESGKTFADPDVLSKKSTTDRGDGKTILPDLIHEALWGISLWRRTQTRDGGIIGGVEYATDGVRGGVSWNPHQNAFAYKPEPWSAYRFIIGAAKLGHVISTTVGDKVLGAALIDEAANAWRWAEAKWPGFVRETSTVPAEDFDPNDASEVPVRVFQARIAAAAVLYRASGQSDARAVFEAHNPFLPLSDLGSFSTQIRVLSNESLEYLRAARDGRDFNDSLAEKLRQWATWRATGPKRMGQDYGLHTSAIYPRGRGWARFGPGSNWRASESAQPYAIGVQQIAAMRDIVVEGMWFGLGCNPSNVSFVQGFGSRQFSDPSGIDYYGTSKVEGQIAFGVCMGDMYPWERNRVEGQLYPADQGDWPAYTQTIESAVVNTCAEHGMKSNAMEWLFANGFVTELLAQSE